MWFGLFGEVELLEGHFPERCFLCLWKVLIRKMELQKSVNVVAVQIFGIITIIPLSWSPWMASPGREEVGAPREHLSSESSCTLGQILQGFSLFGTKIAPN